MADDAASGSFDDILALARPELRRICIALRDAVAALRPGFVESVWTKLRIASIGVGPRTMTEHDASISPQGAHVDLGFDRGAALDDPGGLLEGTGKALRHVKVKDLGRAAGPEVEALLRRAIDERSCNAGGPW